MNVLTIIFLVVLAFILRAVAKTVWTFRPSRQCLVDTLRLNRIFRMERASRMSIERVREKAERIFVRNRFKGGYRLLRNGFTLILNQYGNLSVVAVRETMLDKTGKYQPLFVVYYYLDERGRIEESKTVYSQTRNQIEYLLIRMGATPRQISEFFSGGITEEKEQKAKAEFEEWLLRKLL